MAPARRAITALGLLFSATISAAAQCQQGFVLCQPDGASSTTIPSTGSGLAPLYNSLLDSVQGVHARRAVGHPDIQRREATVRDTPSLCCNEGTTCLNLKNFNVPMCYDRFTTNFKLVDGTTGTVDSGAFSGADGGTADLRSGSFTAGDKSTGNMYSGSNAAQSPTNTAAIPTPFTGTGVGSAIPLTALGVVQTILVTFPGTTVPGTTRTLQTAPSTVPGTTAAATTIAPFTTLILTTLPAGAAAATATSTTSKAGAPARVGSPDGAAGFGIAGLLAAVLML